MKSWVISIFTCPAGLMTGCTASNSSREGGNSATLGRCHRPHQGLCGTQQVFDKWLCRTKWPPHENRGSRFRLNSTKRVRQTSPPCEIGAPQPRHHWPFGADLSLEGWLCMPECVTVHPPAGCQSRPVLSCVTTKTIFVGSLMPLAGRSRLWLGALARSRVWDGWKQTEVFAFPWGLSRPHCLQLVRWRKKMPATGQRRLWPQASAYYGEKKRGEIVFMLLVTMEMHKACSHPRLTVFRVCGSMKTHTRRGQMPSGPWLRNSIKEVCALPAPGRLLGFVSGRTILKTLLNIY